MLVLIIVNDLITEGRDAVDLLKPLFYFKGKFEGVDCEAYANSSKELDALLEEQLSFGLKVSERGYTCGQEELNQINNRISLMENLEEVA